MRLVVIGVGTRRGDDAAGLAVAERLARRELPADAAVARCERPLDLVPWLACAETAVLVDAVRSGAAAGALHRLCPSDLCGAGGLSTHALGVVEALALASALGRCRARVEIIGIEAGAQDGPDEPLTPAVERAVEGVAAWLGARLAACGDPPVEGA